MGEDQVLMAADICEVSSSQCLLCSCPSCPTCPHTCHQSSHYMLAETSMQGDEMDTSQTTTTKKKGAASSATTDSSINGRTSRSARLRLPLSPSPDSVSVVGGVPRRSNRKKVAQKKAASGMEPKPNENPSAPQSFFEDGSEGLDVEQDSGDDDIVASSDIDHNVNANKGKGGRPFQHRNLKGRAKRCRTLTKKKPAHKGARLKTAANQVVNFSALKPISARCSRSGMGLVVTYRPVFQEVTAKRRIRKRPAATSAANTSTPNNTSTNQPLVALKDSSTSPRTPSPKRKERESTSRSPGFFDQIKEVINRHGNPQKEIGVKKWLQGISQSPSPERTDHRSPSPANTENRSLSTMKTEHRSPKFVAAKNRSTTPRKMKYRSPSPTKTDHRSPSPRKMKHRSRSPRKMEHRFPSPRKAKHRSPSLEKAKRCSPSPRKPKHHSPSPKKKMKHRPAKAKITKHHSPSPRKKEHRSPRAEEARSPYVVRRGAHKPFTSAKYSTRKNPIPGPTWNPDEFRRPMTRSKSPYYMPSRRSSHSPHKPWTQAGRSRPRSPKNRSGKKPDSAMDEGESVGSSPTVSPRRRRQSPLSPPTPACRPTSSKGWTVKKNASPQREDKASRGRQKGGKGTGRGHEMTHRVSTSRSRQSHPPTMSRSRSQSHSTMASSETEFEGHRVPDEEDEYRSKRRRHSRYYRHRRDATDKEETSKGFPFCNVM